MYTGNSLPLQISSAERGQSLRAQIEGFGTDSSAKSSPVALCNKGELKFLYPPMPSSSLQWCCFYDAEQEQTIVIVT